jgi:hypothetical protein
MFVKVHKKQRKDSYVNTGSCAVLVDYLEKENEGKSLLESELFFNNEQDNVMSSKVIFSIDNNVKGLKESQDKFYMISVNPSPKELKHMARQATGRDISGVWEMSQAEIKSYNSYFKEYVNKTMDVYAKNFDRGLSKENLVYYAKIEQERTFKGIDKEVKEGLAQSGSKKPGLQTHAHVIVSRMDKDMKKSLSPLANSRGSEKHQLNGKSVRVGFNRDTFKEYSEREFDYHYNYQREKGEKFRDYNPYVGIVKGKMQGKVIHQVLSADPSNSLLIAANSINKIKIVAKDLKLANDIISGTLINPGYAAFKALTRVIGKIKDIGHAVEL